MCAAVANEDPHLCIVASRRKTIEKKRGVKTPVPLQHKETELPPLIVYDQKRYLLLTFSLLFRGWLIKGDVHVEGMTWREMFYRENLFIFSEVMKGILFRSRVLLNKNYCLEF